MASSTKANRPLSVTFLAIGVFIFGVVQLWQAGAICAQMDVLGTLPTIFSPYWRLIAALFWASLAGVLGVLIWRGWSHVRLLVPLCGGAFLFYHLTLIFGSSYMMAQRGWTGNLLLGTFLWLVATWILNRAPARPFFANQPGK
jgi:hypothetical protein